jgi:hypothetical protein
MMKLEFASLCKENAYFCCTAALFHNPCTAALTAVRTAALLH